MKALIQLLALCSLIAVQASQTFQFYAKNGSAIETEADDPEIDWEKIERHQGSEYSGVLSLIAWPNLNGACTGTLLKTWTGPVPQPSTPAYMLTAAHCVSGEFDEEGKFYEKTMVNVAAGDDVAFRPLLIINGQLFGIPYKTIAFATQMFADFAVIELQKTAKELLDVGFKFYPYAAQVEEGSIGFSLGYPSSDLKIRKSKVEILCRIVTDEGDKRNGYDVDLSWVYQGNVAPGMSGGPVINNNNEIVLVNYNALYGRGIGARVNFSDCFTRDGLWNYDNPRCLNDWKELHLEKYGQPRLVLEGDI